MSYHGIIIYFIYRAIRGLFCFLQSKWWPFPKKGDHVICERFRIVHRMKSDMGDFARDCDFFGLHLGFDSAQKLLLRDPKWILYTVSDDFAYFTRMPEPISAYVVTQAPFLYMKQFEEAVELARMPLDQFCRFAKETIGKPKGKVVFFTNTARSGSTLVTRMVQVGENVVALGEPDAFTALAIIQEEKKWSTDFFDSVLESVISVYCKDMGADQTYILKTQSNGTRLVSDIHRLMPEIPHIFQFRANVEKATLSTLRMQDKSGFNGRTLRLWLGFPRFFGWFQGFSRFEQEAVGKVRPRSDLEYAYTIYISPYVFYHRFRHLFAIPCVTYEDLVVEPDRKLTEIFQVCGLDLEWIPEAKKQLNVDSQAGTALSRQALAGIRLREISEEDRIRLNEIADVLGVPESVYRF